MPTARFGVTLPTGASTPDVVRDITAITTALEAIGAQYSQGTRAARPSAAIAGRFYIATDAGVLYYDTGSAWLIFATTPLSYALSGPATFLVGSWGVLATALHLAVAGTWRFTLSADFTSTSTNPPRVMGLDLDVYNLTTHYRAAGTGDQLQTQSLGPLYAISASKQMFVTTPGAADVDLYGYVQAAGGQASNVKLFAELIG